MDVSRIPLSDAGGLYATLGDLALSGLAEIVFDFANPPHAIED